MLLAIQTSRHEVLKFFQNGAHLRFPYFSESSKLSSISNINTNRVSSNDGKIVCYIHKKLLGLQFITERCKLTCN